MVRLVLVMVSSLGLLAGPASAALRGPAPTAPLGPAPAAPLGPAPAAQDRPKVELFDRGEDVEPLGATTVGVPIDLFELVIVGSQLVPTPVADPGKADVIIEVKNWFSHGENHRYNLRITPFVLGRLDIRDYLQRADGSELGDIDPLIIDVDSVLENPAVMALPVDPEVPIPGRVGGYRTLTIVLGVLWVLGLIALLFAGRKKGTTLAGAIDAPPPTLADRLRPLVERAQRGDLSGEERAELERLVIAHWRRQRGLESVPVAEAIQTLRRDEDAGPLLRKVEEWFHRPSSEPLTDAQIAELLRPYRDVVQSGSTGAGGHK